MNDQLQEFYATLSWISADALNFIISLFYRSKSLEGKKLNTKHTEVNARKAPGPDGFVTDFCFNK